MIYIIDEVGDDLDEEVISEIIKKADEDNDRRINFIEFTFYLKKNFVTLAKIVFL